MKKLTFTVSNEVYVGLHSLAGPHVVDAELDEAYLLMALDEKRRLRRRSGLTI